MACHLSSLLKELREEHSERSQAKRGRAGINRMGAQSGAS